MAKLTKPQRLAYIFLRLKNVKDEVWISDTQARFFLAGIEYSQDHPAAYINKKNSHNYVAVGKFVKNLLKICTGDDDVLIKNEEMDIILDIANGVKVIREDGKNVWALNYFTKTIKIKERQFLTAVDFAEKLLEKTSNDIWKKVLNKKDQTKVILKKAQEYEISNKRTFSGHIRFTALKRGNNRCCFCGRTAAETTLEVDHIIPWSKGGATSIANSRVVCSECNKGVYHAEQKHADAPVISR